MPAIVSRGESEPGYSVTCNVMPQRVADGKILSFQCQEFGATSALKWSMTSHYIRWDVSRESRGERNGEAKCLEHSAQPKQYSGKEGRMHAYLSANHISKRKGKTNP